MDNDFFDNMAEDVFAIQANDSLVEYPPALPGKSRVVQQIIEAVPGLSYSYLVGLLRQTSWVAAKGAGTPRNDEEWGKRDRLTYRLVEEILLYCKQKSWPVTIVTPNVTEQPDLFYTVDQHWNAKGHKHVARQVLAFLKDSGILAK
jgi:hypothetical protein